MSRYVVRFLVAILTFGIGVTLSLALGFFTPQKIAFSGPWVTKSTSCPKSYRSSIRPMSLESRSQEPLKILYLGAFPNADGKETRMRFLIENRSGETISHYSISGAKLHAMDEFDSDELHWSSNIRLEPGETRTISFRRDAGDSVTLRVDRVTYQDGSVWVNPRRLR